MRYLTAIRLMTGWLVCVILAASLASPARAEEELNDSIWIRHRGFRDFSQGTVGNSGANLYVSHQGRVQTINRWDLNRDGYLDLLFTQDHCDLDNPDALIYWGREQGYESWLPPRWEYRNLFSLWDFLSSDHHRRIVKKLPAEGGGRAEIADLNADGYPDIIFCNMIHNFRRDQPLYIYWGSTDEYSTENRTKLPAYTASGIAVGDLNGDGFPELVVANLGDELGVVWGLCYHLASYIYWGSASRYDVSRRTALPTVSARDVTIGDFDGDQSPDLAFINYNSKEQSAYIYWGEEGEYSPESRQTFAAHEIPEGPTTVEAAALNDDNFDDLIIAGGAQVVIYSGSADGLVADQTLSLPAGSINDVKAVDLNGDGLRDLVVANSDAPTSSVLWASAQGFQVEDRTDLPTLNARSVSVADLNGDGRPDLLFGNSQDGTRCDVPSYIYWNGPRGFSPYRRADLIGAYVGGTAISDLNRDGRPDILLVNQLSNSREPSPSLVFWGNPDHCYSPAAMATIEEGGFMMYSTADLDDDGWPDLIFLGGEGPYIAWGAEEGYTLENRTPLALTEIEVVSSRVADLNSDGYLDLLFTASGSAPGEAKVTVVWGDEHRFSQLHTDEIPFPGPFSEVTPVADLNRDGHLDLILPCIDSAQFEIKWGSAAGYSEANRTLLEAHGSGVAQVADLDADGWLDLVLPGFLDPRVQSLASNKTMIYWGGPEGFSEGVRTELESHMALNLTVADFNRDGHLDLAQTNYRSDTVRDLVCFIYWGGPGRSFSEKRRTLIHGGSSAAINALDLNQDGWPELVITNHKLNHDHS